MFSLHLLQLETGLGRIVPYSVGGPPRARLFGHNLESGAGHCLIDCGGLSLP